MAIASSGAVSFDDLRTEFNASGSVSFSDFYRGAATNYVRANAANNSSTNLAASVPASGAINFTNFRGAARGFRKTYAANATNQNANSVFGSDWGVNYPKDIVINSGVTLGATSTSEEALEINSGGLGTITITNNGTLIGAGGSGNGGAGGDAFEAAVACTFVNNGYVYAGGGGGGQGGTGGNGTYSSTSTLSPYSSNRWIAASNGYSEPRYLIIRKNGSNVVSTYIGTSVLSLTSYGSYSRGSLVEIQYNQDNEQPAYNYYLQETSSGSTSGGAGGSGGQGAGYNQSAAAGSGGAAGGTNAGSGGSGGTGGGYGANGSTGSTGANGNASNGSAGSSGGAAGKYIRGISNVTFTNNGTVAGGTA